VLEIKAKAKAIHAAVWNILIGILPEVRAVGCTLTQSNSDLGYCR
jgi:hypothetical protein